VGDEEGKREGEVQTQEVNQDGRVERFHARLAQKRLLALLGGRDPPA
jgi:hypothetical protein